MDLESFELCYTLEGSGRLEYDGKSYLLKKGDGFFINCRKPHLYKTAGSSWKAAFLHFDGPLCGDFFTQFSQNGSVTFSEAYFPNFEGLQYEILKAVQKAAACRDYKISCLFDLLLTELLTSTAAVPVKWHMPPDIIEQILDYIKEHYTEKITIKLLSKTFGISPAHLEREFKKYTGFSPNAYNVNYRLIQSKLLLKNTYLSVGQISSMTGFGDSSQFIRIFKKHVGTTPLKYRKK